MIYIFICVCPNIRDHLNIFQNMHRVIHSFESGYQNHHTVVCVFSTGAYVCSKVDGRKIEL